MKRLLTVLLCAVTFGVAAQQGVVTGRVVDARTGEYIEYANVALLKAVDSSLVNGTVSEVNGGFAVTVPSGRYLLRVTFMGYDTYFHAQTLTLGDGRREVNVGKVKLKAHAKTMEAVEISAERSMVEYQLDKRVINVDKNLVTGGGTATDVLEQVPSVAVDNDGNVTLRGSTNVKVLVNGRPSELLASDLATLLEQIPASTVENVEVITNPSAKYDPEGMSGIINIKLKDKTAGALGLNGVVNLNAGAPLPFMIPDDQPQFIPTVMGNVSLNYTTEKYNLFFNADGGMRQRGNKSHTDIEYFDTAGATRSNYSIDQFSLNPNYMGSVKVGGEYYFDDQNSLLLSYQLRGGNRRRNSDITAVDMMHSNDSLHYDQKGTGDNRNVNHSFNMLYTKKFDRKDEELTVDATFSTRRVAGDGMQEQVYRDAAANYDHYYLRDSETENSHQALNIKANWLRPLDSFFGMEGWRLETGYEGRMDWPNQKADYYRSTSSTDHACVRQHLVDALRLPPACACRLRHAGRQPHEETLGPGGPPRRVCHHLRSRHQTPRHQAGGQDLLAALSDAAPVVQVQRHAEHAGELQPPCAPSAHVGPQPLHGCPRGRPDKLRQPQPRPRVHQRLRALLQPRHRQGEHLHLALLPPDQQHDYPLRVHVGCRQCE